LYGNFDIPEIFVSVDVSLTQADLEEVQGNSEVLVGSFIQRASKADSLSS